MHLPPKLHTLNSLDKVTKYDGTRVREEVRTDDLIDATKLEKFTTETVYRSRTLTNTSRREIIIHHIGLLWNHGGSKV